MNIFKATRDTVLTDVVLKSYNIHLDSQEVLERYQTYNLVKFIEDIESMSIFADSLSKDKLKTYPKKICIEYTVDGKQFKLPIVTSNGIEIPLNSEIIIASILTGIDLVKNVKKDTDNYSIAITYLIKEIIIRLEEYKFYHSDSINKQRELSVSIDGDYDSEVFNRLKYIPFRNLRGLLLYFNQIFYSCGEILSLSNFLRVSHVLGVLKFEPYITKNSYGEYILALSYNRYIHLFKDKYYRCSIIAEGIGEYTSSSVQLDSTVKLFGSSLKESRLLKILYYMNLINCCKEIPEFSKLLKNNPHLVDEFMEKSTRRIFDSYDINYSSDMLDVIKPEQHKVILNSIDVYDAYMQLYGEPVKILRVSAGGNLDYCRIRIYSMRSVGIEFAIEDEIKEVIFSLPNWADGLDVSDRKPNINRRGEWYNSMSRKIYSSLDVFHTFVEYALSVCGYATNYYSTNKINEDEQYLLNSINRKGVLEFNSLSDLDSDEISALPFIDISI